MMLAAFDKFKQWVATVTYKQHRFVLGVAGARMFLQLQWDGNDSDTKEPAVVHGRKWFLSEHMTKSEVVQTALAAVLAAEEHEAREAFLYDGRAIFGPHFNVDALHTMMELTNAQERRDETVQRKAE